MCCRKVEPVSVPGVYVGFLDKTKVVLKLLARIASPISSCDARSSMSFECQVKTFTLRGRRIAPLYMHDGRAHLEDTVELFNLGMKLLAPQEKQDLVEFMHVL